MTNVSPQSTQRQDHVRQGSGAAGGSRSLAFVLDQCEYPCDKEELMENVGDQEVEFADGGTTTVGRILQGIPEREYLDASVAKLAIFTRWESIRKDLGTGPRAHRRTGRKGSRRARRRS